MEKPIIPDPQQTATLYTDEEAQEILSRAMGLGDEGITRESLVRMASELGISPTELARAESEYRTSSAVEGDRVAFRAEQRMHLRSHLLTYVIVVAFLWMFFGFIAAFVAREIGVLIPALFVTFGWGIGIAAHVMNYLSRQSGPAFEHAFEPWHERQEQRRERVARRRLKG